MSSTLYRIARRRIVVLVAPLLLALAVLLPVTAARAEWFYTKGGAEIMAKDFVSKHYANTYHENLLASCRPQGRRASDPSYKYHRWVCSWVDSSDHTAGAVLIVGSDFRSTYYGKVLVGARHV
jgi:hypothetical protein